MIDSATEYLYLALYDGNDKRCSVFQKGENNHSETLMVELESIFESEQLKPTDIDEIYVGIGPGSYTGVRIGVVVAKMLAYSLSVPVFKVSSLALLASGSSAPTSIPIIDARRGYVFAGVYSFENGILRATVEDTYIQLDKLKDSHNGELVTDSEPCFEVILKSELYQKVEDVHRLAPVYLRKTEAETNLSKG